MVAKHNDHLTNHNLDSTLVSSLNAERVSRVQK